MAAMLSKRVTAAAFMMIHGVSAGRLSAEDEVSSSPAVSAATEALSANGMNQAFIKLERWAKSQGYNPAEIYVPMGKDGKAGKLGKAGKVGKVSSSLLESESARLVNEEDEVSPEFDQATMQMLKHDMDTAVDKSNAVGTGSIRAKPGLSLVEGLRTQDSFESQAKQAERNRQTMMMLKAGMDTAPEMVRARRAAEAIWHTTQLGSKHSLMETDGLSDAKSAEAAREEEAERNRQVMLQIKADMDKSEDS